MITPAREPSRRGGLAVRLVIVACGLALVTSSVTVGAPLDVRAVLAAIGLFTIAVSFAPVEVRQWLRREWPGIARLLASIILTAVAVTLSRRSSTRWITVTGTISTALLELVFALLIDKKIRSWIKFLSIDQWRAIDAETERSPEQAGAFSWHILVILVVCAVSLTLQEYLGDRGWFERVFPHKAGDEYFDLRGFAWWSGWRVFGYVVMPTIAILAMPGVRWRDFHVSLRGFFSHLWIYVLMFSLILFAVIEASTTTSFRHTYPFYRMANRSSFDLWSWEALYAAQFLSLEFFFRGFLLQGLRRALGSNAIFVMIVPYCMIHYGKPLPETLGAIGAGVILGTLAMRTRSIWGGVMIHIGVAITMDVLALRGCPPMGSGRSCGH